MEPTDQPAQGIPPKLASNFVDECDEYLRLHAAGTRHETSKLEAADRTTYDSAQRCQYHDTGMFRLAHGEQYLSSVSTAETQQGPSIHSYDKGGQHQGLWHDGFRCSQGWSAFQNEHAYKGEWPSGRLHSHGLCAVADGNSFEAYPEGSVWEQTAASPRCTTIEGWGLACAVAGLPSSFIIQAKDENGHFRLNGGEAFSAYLQGPEPVPVIINDNKDGTYLAIYRAIRAGQYQLHVLFEGQANVAESPYCIGVVPGIASLKHCRLQLPPAEQIKAGQPCSFMLHLCDSCSNRCLVDSIQSKAVECLVMGSEGSLQTDLAALPDGSWAGTFRPMRQGYLRLDFTVDGESAGQSPYSIQVYPSGSKAQTSALRISEAMYAYEAIAAAAAAAAAAPSAADSSCWSGSSKSLTAGQYNVQEDPAVAEMDALWYKFKTSHLPCMDGPQLASSRNSGESIKTKGLRRLPRQAR